MGATVQETVGTYYFTLSLGGAEVAGFFKEVTGLTSEHQVVENTASDQKGIPIVQKFPGQIKWGNITLKRGIDTGMDLWNWRKQIIDGKVKDARKDCTIQLVNWANEPITTFNVVRAWPCKYSAPGLNAGGNEILIEEIELAHEGFTRE